MPRDKRGLRTIELSCRNYVTNSIPTIKTILDMSFVLEPRGASGERKSTDAVILQNPGVKCR